jgi:hypothetical protein
MKQNLNTRSSTEDELVAVDYMMPQVFWKRYFLENQGFNVGPTRSLQDDQSAILFEEKGMASSSKRACHFHIMFYFVMDQININNISF